MTARAVTLKSLRDQVARLEKEVDRRPRTLTLAGAADYSGISAWTIRRLALDNQIAAVRNGTKDKGTILVVRESLDLYLDSLPSA